MNTQIYDLAHLGQIVIKQELKNDRDSPALRFLMQTFEEIKQTANPPLKVIVYACPKHQARIF